MVFAYLLECLFILDRVCGFVHMQFTSYYHNKFFIVVQFDSIVEAGFLQPFDLKVSQAREFETDASSSYGRD